MVASVVIVLAVITVIIVLVLLAKGTQYDRLLYDYFTLLILPLQQLIYYSSS